MIPELANKQTAISTSIDTELYFEKEILQMTRALLSCRSISFPPELSIKVQVYSS